MTDLLERQLAALAERLDVDVGQRLVRDVLASLDAVGGAASAAGRRRDVPRRRRRIVAAAVAAALVTPLAVPGSRHVIAHWFGISSTRIERSPTAPVAPQLPATVPSNQPAGGADTAPPGTASIPTTAAATFPATLRLGEPTTAADAAARTGLPVPVPTALGAPGAIFVVTPPANGQVVVVYPASATLPASPVAGVGALLSTVPGTIDRGMFLKVAGAGTVVEELTFVVASGSTVHAIWLAGEPHQYAFDDAAGSPVFDDLRLATNTLLWNDNGVGYRLEASIARDEAVRIASSVIPTR